MSWLSRHAHAIEALAASITAIVALLALVGVKLQIDAAAELQAQQSARDIYRGFLELSIAQPQFSQPQPCTGITGPEDPGYTAYLDYLLYTSEQVIALDNGWGPVMEHWLVRHSSQLCTIDDAVGWVTPEVADLISGLKARHCATAPACN